jgi:hypothetical protein
LRIWWGEEGESPVSEESETEVEPVAKSESEDEPPVDFTEPCTAAPEPATGDWSTSVHFKYFADTWVNYF